MSDQLLATKLHPPLLRQDLVTRIRLYRLLQDDLWQPLGFVRKLTLVSAPAGFGKTTLVRSWLHASAFQFTWLSLDENDNDPARFLAYLVAALRQINPEAGGAILPLLQLRDPPPAPVIMTVLINEFAAHQAPLILVLDDYQAIHSAQIHQQLSFLIDHQPQNLHLALLTREDPLLPTARLRASGQLLEIRQADLRFNAEETCEFFQKTTGQWLDSDDLARLEDYTEGWAAGLQLAALSLHDRTDAGHFIEVLSSSNRFILDYLLDEVYNLQTPVVQQFLLQTSILRQLSGPLCDAVTVSNHCTPLLQTLEQANLLIAPVNEQRTWYRYHPLFAELLQQRLRSSDIIEKELHERASQWYEDQALLQEAVDHALSAQDWPRAARLTGTLSDSLLRRGEAVTLLRLCEKIPQVVIFSSPELCLTYTWAALLTSQFETADQLLAQLELQASPTSGLMGQVAAAQAFLARARRQTARAIEKSEQALALLPQETLGMRGNIAMNLGLAYWHEGRLAAAEKVLAQAEALCSASENVFGLLTVKIFQARIPAVQGRLHQARDAMLHLLEEHGQTPILCLVHYDLVAIYLEWNDLPKAGEHFSQGFSLSQRSGNLEFIQSGHLLRAYLAWARCEQAEAWAALSEADALARQSPTEVRSRCAALGIQLALTWNDPHSLAHWSSQLAAEVDAHSFYRFIGLGKARLSFAQNNLSEAASDLAALAATASQGGWEYGLFVIRLLQCLSAKNQAEAMSFLGQALEFGQPQGFLHSFIEVGPRLIPLLQEAALRGIQPEYVGRILAALGNVGIPQVPAPDSPVEALSMREVEVLRLIAAGLSNREIAQKLFISPGTAKTHIHNLCGKLGVRNRTEAAMRASELHLL